MATVTGLTAERMEAIEAQSVVDGEIVGDNLILTRFDESTIDAGNVRGPTGSPGISEEELSNELSSHMPVGSIVDYVGVAAPTNWLTMIGQTIVDGETLHPELWAVLPATMKVSSNIVMPDTRGRVTVGYSSAEAEFNVIGEIGGAKTHVLTTAEMPSHTHTGPSHVHTGPSHSHNSGTLATGNNNANHSHAFAANTSTGGAHGHLPGAESAFANVSSGFQATEVAHTNSTGRWVTGGGSATPSFATANAGDHYHTVNGTSDNQNANHSHAVNSGSTGASGTADTGPSGTAATGPTGSGTAHNNLQPYVTFLKIIKAV